MKISNWGNYPQIEAELKEFNTLPELKRIVDGNSELIPRGMGRCYGDSALNSLIVSTTKFQRFIEFDETKGLLTVECGVVLAEILKYFIPKGWFLQVTPGTKFVTVGGAIASDVHGKNHHKVGSFSQHITSLDILLSTGDIVSCSPRQNEELFWSTCGGMGLTGVIVRASIQLLKIETAYIQQKTIRADNLENIMQIFTENEACTYSVAWIDCLAKGKNLGRSVLMLGEHASGEQVVSLIKNGSPLFLHRKKTFNLPFHFPGFSVNSFTQTIFNNLYYHKHSAREQNGLVGYDSFFYPLDFIENWNRIYGSRGFTQYQLVLPLEQSERGLAKVLSLTTKMGMGSFLAVLKLLGEQEGLISFPRRGFTFTLDLPITKTVFPFLQELDRIVLDHGGRLYLTKDVRMKREMFLKGYDRADEFIEYKQKFDPRRKFQSLQSKRLGL